MGSLFLRGLFSRYLQEGKCDADISASARNSLCHLILPHCGMVGARFVWDEAGTPTIREVCPLLGTQLEPFDASLANRPAGIAASSLAVLSGGCACARKGGNISCSLM